MGATGCLCRWILLASAVMATACSGAAATNPEHAVERPPLLAAPRVSAPTTEPIPTTVAPVPPPPSTTSTTSTTTPPSTTAATTPPPVARSLHEQAWQPYATIGPVTLHHPTDQVEAIGYHQSGHDGAQPQSATAGSARWFTLDQRGRDTHPQGAADIVVAPDREVRAPVTGTVLRAGTYTLYCDHVDQYAVIEPDARPGWEVKVLHVDGLALTDGQRVEAGVTRLAARARVLPFPSQIEERTALPPWPHVHIEVVDPSIPDRPSGPGCP